MESSSSTEGETDKGKEVSKRQNKDLRKANKELWRRVEELHNEKSSLAKENADLKKTIDDLPPIVPGNSLIFCSANSNF